jgi:hypothetical protein
MATSQQRFRGMRIALAIALGLTVLAALAKPLLSNQLANVLPGTPERLIAESENGGG